MFETGEVISKTRELLVKPLPQSKDVARLVISGMSHGKQLRENICELTDHTRVVFIERDKYQNIAEKTSIDADTNTETILLPEDVNPEELIAFIEKLYETRSFAGFNVKEVLSDRLLATGTHLAKILKRAESSFHGIEKGKLEPLIELQRGISSLAKKLDDSKNESREQSAIGFSNEEIDDRINRLSAKLGTKEGDAIFERYVSLLVHSGLGGLGDEIQSRLLAETTIALYTRGNRFLTDSLPKSEIFDELNEKRKGGLKERFFRQFDRWVQFINPSSEIRNYELLKESLAPMTEALKTVRSKSGVAPEILEAEETKFLHEILRIISTYDGWTSDYATDVSRTSPSKVVELGEMGCISRCALEYGLLRDAGFTDDELFSMDGSGHASLIVKTAKGIYIMENTMGANHKADYEVVRVENMESVQKILNELARGRKVKIPGQNLVSSSFFYDRDSIIYRGNRGFGIMFMNHLSYVLKNAGRHEEANEVARYILTIDPGNHRALKIIN